MDAHVFTAMMEKYSPWLMKWIVYRTGQCKTPSQTDEGFQRILAAKVKSVTALPWTDLSTGRETLPSTTPVEGAASRFIIVLKYHVALWKKRENANIVYAGVDKKASVSVDDILMLIWSECGLGDTPQVVSVIQTIYTIDTASMNESTHDFVAYPCSKENFERWVDNHRERINTVLGERKLMLSGYSVVALDH